MTSDRKRSPMGIGDTELASNPGKNPKRVEAGKCNRAKRRGLTPAGRERLRGDGA